MAEDRKQSCTGAEMIRRPAANCLRGPLRDCARNRFDDGEQARCLLNAGAETEDTDGVGRTPLHWAAARGHAKVARALLDAGANAAARDAAGKTPLHCASFAGHVAVVEALLKQDGSGGYPAADRTLMTPNMSRTSCCHNGKGVEEAVHTCRSPLIDARNAYGSTSLHRAAFNGREKTLRALLQGGASVNLLGKSGRSALHLACRNAHAGCVEVLLAWGADEGATSNDGSTPWSELSIASEDRRSGHPDIIRAALALRMAQSKRAWRRRGWLVMLHALRQKRLGLGFGRLSLGDAIGEDSRDRESTRSISHDVVGTRPQMPLAEGAVHSRDHAFERLIHRLLDSGEEGTFRQIVTYL